MNDIAQRVTAIAAEEFRVPATSLMPDSNSETVKNWDSTAQLGFSMRLEQTFGVSFDIDEIIELQTLQDFIDIVAKKTAA